MKDKTRKYLHNRYRKISWDETPPEEPIDALHCWPDLRTCVGQHYKTLPGTGKKYAGTAQPLTFECTDRFMKSLNKYCTSRKRKLQFIDALTKVVYRIPTTGLYDRAIKERADLRHFYVSRSWRVFYQKKENRIILENFGPHKKLAAYRK